MAPDKLSRSRSDPGHGYGAPIKSAFNTGKGAQINGPIYGNVYNGEDVPGTVAVFKQSLGFPEMNSRYYGITSGAEYPTCGWLLKHEEYQKWQKYGGLLWIKGKPCSGKSTLLRYAFDQRRSPDNQGQSADDQTQADNQTQTGDPTQAENQTQTDATQIDNQTRIDPTQTNNPTQTDNQAQTGDQTQTDPTQTNNQTQTGNPTQTDPAQTDPTQTNNQTQTDDQTQTGDQEKSTGNVTTCSDGKKHITLSFFFHGRGSPLQKTILGFYRTVLFQLLDELSTFEDKPKELSKLEAFFRRQHYSRGLPEESRQ